MMLPRIPAFVYAGTNMAHSGFAIFRAHNPTRDRFLCFLSGIIVRQTGDGKAEVTPFLHSANTNKGSLSGEDFQLPPGATVIFSVPRPEGRCTWQCLFCLNHAYYSKEHPWQTKAQLFAQRLGLHFGEMGLTVSSGEIAQ